MAIFTVHAKGDPAASSEAALGAVLVKDGFSWPAFLFGPLWLMVKRLWLAAIVYVAVMAVVAAGFDAAHVPAIWTSLIGVLVNLLLGCEAASLLGDRLARQGFALSGVVEAGRRDDAERRYFTSLAGPARPPTGAAIPSFGAS